MNHGMDSHVKKMLVQSAGVYGKKQHIYTAKSKHTFTHTKLEICIQVVCVVTARTHFQHTHTHTAGSWSGVCGSSRDERGMEEKDIDVHRNAAPRERFVCEDSSAFRFV